MVGPRTAPVRTEITNSFTLKQRRLHLVLVDPRERPYAGFEYVLTVGRMELRGTTGPDGSITHEVPGLPTGELVLTLPPPSKPEPPARAEPEEVPPGTPPPYPPPVADEDFPDATSPATPSPVALRWELRLQSLAGFDSDATRAAQERLHNLGFTLHGERGAPGPRTRAAVRAFQRHHRLPETGQLADIQRELIHRHDA